MLDVARPSHAFLSLVLVFSCLTLPLRVRAQDAPPSASSPSASTAPAAQPLTNAPSSPAVTGVFALPQFAYDKEPLPIDPAAALQMVSLANGLGGEDLKPWYLKAHYQTYDARGKAASKGVFQLYWTAKDHYRVEYAGDDFTQTVYKNEEGTYRLGDAGEVPYAESQIWKQFLHPVEISGKPPIPLLREETLGTLTETCLEPSSDRSNLNRTLYCVEPKMPLLRTSSSNGYMTVFNKIRVFQHHFTAGEIMVGDYGFNLVTITVDELHSMPDLQALVPPAGATKVDGARDWNGDANDAVKEWVVAGHIIRKTQPDYPMQAKMRHVEGIVRIAATIGKDGLVHDPKVVHNPDDQLSEAALKAVSKWACVPYLLNGQPAEVHTQMNVIFTLAR